jgi:hypothetical protein
MRLTMSVKDVKRRHALQGSCGLFLGKTAQGGYERVAKVCFGEWREHAPQDAGENVAC